MPTYEAWDTTPANLIADLTSRLQANGWTVNSGKFYGVGGGRTLCISLDSASASGLSLTAYNESGTGGKGFVVAYNATATSNPIHAVLSVSTQHLFLSVEGPYWNETGAAQATSGYGSPAGYFCLAPIVPYQTLDTQTESLVCAAGFVGLSFNAHPKCFIRRGFNAASWADARLMTVRPVTNTETYSVINKNTGAGLGSGVYLWPYLVVDENMGLRGRLDRLFYCSDGSSVAGDVPAATYINLRCSVAGVNYRVVRSHKVIQSRDVPLVGPLGDARGTTPTTLNGPYIAIPE
jgi:hypothetical protein